jgi:hypothetical protein
MMRMRQLNRATTSLSLLFLNGLNWPQSLHKSRLLSKIVWRLCGESDDRLLDSNSCKN